MPPLPTKSIPVCERLVVALDVASADEARALAGRLGDCVAFYKLGLELFMSPGYFELVDWLHARGKKIFADLKFNDIPTTVAAAVRQLRHRPIHFATIHGDTNTMKAAADEKGALKLLAVTVLTSTSEASLKEMGVTEALDALVLSRARAALQSGLDGVITSGAEAARIRKATSDDFLIVVPGIRARAGVDDQKRTVDVEQVFENGADFIVVGRPIRSAADPARAAEDFQRRIAALFDASAISAQRPSSR